MTIETPTRKLASVQRIEDLTPIPGADAILRSRVLGWTQVVRLDEVEAFRASGDLCVFFEIDAQLPDGPAWSEFMRKHQFVVRTVRLRGVLAQGLALPVSILGEGPVPPVGTDVSERLGVVHYEREVPDDHRICGPFPPLVPKTGELRLQSYPGVLDDIRGHAFYVTTKIDGVSGTFYQPLDGGPLVACQRNWSAAPGDHPIWRIVDRYDLRVAIPSGLAVQGELAGPGVPGKKNRLGLKEMEFFVFNVYDVRRDRFLNYHEIVAFCRDRGLRMVPVERVVEGQEAAEYVHTLEGWLQAAQGCYEGTTVRKEGIVVRPVDLVRSEALGGSRLSFKVINNDFLLKDQA